MVCYKLIHISKGKCGIRLPIDAFYQPVSYSIFSRSLREKEQKLFETVPEELVTPYMESEEAEVDISTSGISYKDKLMKRRAKQAGNATPEPQAVASSPFPVQEKAPEPPTPQQFAQVPSPPPVTKVEPQILNPDP